MPSPNHTTPDGKQSPEAPPLWRKHFPIESASDAAQSRRGFLGGLAVAGGTMACCQAAMSIGDADTTKDNGGDTPPSGGWTNHPPLVLEKKIHELTDGQAMLFHFPNHRSPCLLVKFSDDDFVAYSQKCTHLACPVIPEVEHNEFHCPCHHGVFDLRTGAPKAGPPRRPLPRIRIERSADGTLTATGVQA